MLMSDLGILLFLKSQMSLNSGDPVQEFMFYSNQDLTARNDVQVNPYAKVTDWMFGVVAVVIIANIVMIATLGVCA
jgi:hypothetical protein